MLLNNQWITEEIKEEMKKAPRDMKTKAHHPKPMGHSESSSKREVYNSKTIPPQETRKITNSQHNLTRRAMREKTTPPPN